MTASIQRSNNGLDSFPISLSSSAPAALPVALPVFGSSSLELKNRVDTIQAALCAFKAAKTLTVKERLISFFKNIALTIALGGARLLHRFDKEMPAFLKKMLTMLVDGISSRLIEPRSVEVMQEEAESMPFSFKHFQGAAAETPGPVAVDQLFYQQKQVGYMCTIHGLCHFAGRKIRNIIGDLIKTNNDYWCKKFQNDGTSKEKALEIMKRANVYRDSVDSINRCGGFTTTVVREFMQSHKEIFHLSKTCTMRNEYAPLDSEEICNALQEIEADPHRHRILISIQGKNYDHAVAIRKDRAGLWRIVDSIAKRSSVISKMQPSFTTLKEAIVTAMRNHQSQSTWLSLIYPSEDNA